MFIFKSGVLIVTLTSLISLPVTSNALAQEELEGPGVFSGEKGEFSLSKIFSGKDAKNTSTLKAGGSMEPENDASDNAKLNPTSTNQLSNVSQQVDEFALFKAWKLAKSQNDSDYQEFKLWLEYKHYQQQKATH